MGNHIVVGAGSSGAIIAARLSEGPNTSVLLMEAGPDYENQNTTPADLLDSKNLAGPAHDWGYKAIPVEGRIIRYQRGKVVGGTSAINAVLAAKKTLSTDLQGYIAWLKANPDKASM